MRDDLRIIQQWVKPSSQVLDLGCGEGQLLSYLQANKQVNGYGLEINPDKITACIRNGVNVLEQNLDDGLSNFADDSMDTVIMTQALQVVRRPDELLEEMLRIGKEAIVTFPNFGFWKTRFYLLLKGRMPMSETLPYNWYDTPNIHMCTFRDFEILCHEKNIRILNKTVMDDNHQEHWSIRLWPAMLGEIAVYHVTRK
ncbi:methionine biosynthesis protein MetW [Thalassolituus sp.]|uniref:methionine biosynthesis protein MetW n=1 Tax=Thalassolituus sp. TaxID=2030822 RepID=UPI00261DCA18|nr:methionine biosynthesis protein MetW [uncultured Thalassolituus sp.]